MSDRHSPYNLFGLDLAEAIGRIKLGWRQLLWSEKHRYSCAILPSSAIR